jgi:GTP-binding protein Era
MSDTKTRCGAVALVGAPNAGKSTLTNALVGAKVAIVSPKVQTTRARLMGIASEGMTQLLLTDTPGIFAPTRRLDRAMVKAAWGGATDADVIVLVVDARRGLSNDVRAIVEGLQQVKSPCLLVLNKVDICAKDRLLKLTADMKDLHVWHDIFMVSAQTGDGVPALRAYLASLMPESPWHYPEDQLTDTTQRLMAAEITREKLYLMLHQELPYSATVETEKWEQRADGSAAIHQVIYIERESQKAIILGHKGAQIKSIGATARADMIEAFGHKVHLFLHVKVKPDWADNRDVYRGTGIDWVD